MPNYSYRCTNCGRTCVRNRPIAERDNPGVNCICAPKPGQPISKLERVPDAPSFKVNGFNAGNGYANKD